MARQSLPQFILAGTLVTVPEPVPDFETTKLLPDPFINTAVTVTSAFAVMTQAPVPLHAPDQPEKVEPPPGVAARTCLVP
jgi:hypothetical protein